VNIKRIIRQMPIIFYMTLVTYICVTIYVTLVTYVLNHLLGSIA